MLQTYGPLAGGLKVRLVPGLALARPPLTGVHKGTPAAVGRSGFRATRWAPQQGLMGDRFPGHGVTEMPHARSSVTRLAHGWMTVDGFERSCPPS